MFVVENHKVVLNQDIFFIPEYKAVLEEYGTDCIKVFQLIYYLYDFNSVYNKLSEDEKIIEVMKDHNPDGFVDLEEEVVKAAVDKFLFFQTTPTIRLWQGARYAVEAAANYLHKYKDKKQATEKETSSILTQLEKLEKAVSSLKKLEDIVKLEIAETKGRGFKYMSRREIPKNNANLRYE